MPDCPGCWKSNLGLKRKQKNSAFQKKGDGSPITKADLEANEFICNNLKSLMPDTPIVSEEGMLGDPSSSEKSFVVDPLDGTKEFIKGNEMYTVNIALLQRTGSSSWRPILGLSWPLKLGPHGLVEIK